VSSESGLQPLLAQLTAPGSLDGSIHADLPARLALAQDAGGLVSRLPGAVLRPGSVADVQRAIQLCQRYDVRVVARGQGHTTLGQAQVQFGLLIDMRSLCSVHEIESDWVRVDAGATWRGLLEATAPFELTPPVLTGFQGLTIGGTLSVGGISGTAYKRGPQLEQVLELEVVTGRGELVTCSPRERSELFDAALGGLGMCALIVRAKLRLVPRPRRVHATTLTFDRLGPFLGAMSALVTQGELDSISANIYPLPGHEVRFELNALSFDTPGPLAESAPALAGEVERAQRELGYLDHCLMVDHLLESPNAGWEGFAHPWFDAFLPGSRFGDFLEQVVPGLDPCRDVGPAPLGALAQIHVFPLLTRHLRRPLLRVPREPLVYLFDILTSGYEPGTSSAYRAQMLERNRALFECARAHGGTRYNIAALPLTQAGWQSELGEAFPAFAKQKQQHDPGAILGSVEWRHPLAI
jgi:FAD/FMN-containing dehydrogenase